MPGLNFYRNNQAKGRGWPMPIGIAITESPAGSGANFTVKGKNQLNAGGSASPTHTPPIVGSKIVPHGFYQGEKLQEDPAKRAGPFEKNPRNYDGGTISGAEYVMIQNNEAPYCPRATVPFTENFSGFNSPSRFYLHIFSQNAAPIWNNFVVDGASKRALRKGGTKAPSLLHLVPAGASADNWTTNKGSGNKFANDQIQIQNSPFYTSIQIPNDVAGPLIIKKRKTDRMYVSNVPKLSTTILGNKPLGVVMTPMGRRSGM
jgi:hypothetical protein